MTEVCMTTALQGPLLLTFILHAAEGLKHTVLDADRGGFSVFRIQRSPALTLSTTLTPWWPIAASG